jgi:hypothetical protein
MADSFLHFKDSVKIGMLVLGLAGVSLTKLANADSFAKYEINQDMSPLAGLIHEDLKILNQTQTGQKIIEHALKKMNYNSLVELAHHIQAGSVSITQSTYERKLDPVTQQQSESRRVQVVLKTQQPQPDRIFDLAHELTHADASTIVKPYEPDLTLDQYIKLNLESDGGEIQAFYNECQVVKELTELNKVKTNRCKKYFNQTLAEIAQDFYRVGSYFTTLDSILGGKLGTIFPLMKNSEPVILSASAHASYPEALSKEYNELNQLACKNTQKRIRSIASVNAQPESRDQLMLKKRCQSMSSQMLN